MSAFENLLSPRAKLIVKRAVQLRTGSVGLDKTHIIAFTQLLDASPEFAATFNDMATRKNISVSMIDSIAKTLNESMSYEADAA